MKVVKITLLIIGGIILVVAAVMLFMALMVNLKVLWEIATRYQGGGSQNGLVDPRMNILIITGLALAAGLLIGLGIGLPRRRALSDAKMDAAVEARVQERFKGSWAEHAQSQTPPTPPAAS